MTDIELQEIESALGLELPEDYREASKAGLLQDPLHEDALAIIGINRSFRAGDFGDQNWPKNLLAFGHDGAGSYFCIDVEQPSGLVHFRDHETREVTPEGAAFLSWLKKWKAANGVA